MSVLVYKRQKSNVQYIDTARVLVKHTFSSVKHFPKSVMFLLTKEIVDNARGVYVDVVKANVIYPKSALDVEIRYKLLVDALGNLRALDGLLSIAKAIYNLDLTEHAWLEFGRLIIEEEKLIKGIIKSDKNIGYML